MDLGTVFKLSLYGLTALVGVILGAAEGEGSNSGSARSEFVLPFLSLPVVVCGYLVTERRRISSKHGATGLSSWWANSLGIIALVATFYEFLSENREGKLLAGTHLLLYATWIVLFQQKTVRLYWFLMALGILQLAVASVLTTKGWFGFCAVAYMFSAVWTLSIFSLWRAEQLFEEEDRLRLAEKAERGDDVLFSPISRSAIRQSEVRSAVQHEDGTQWLTVRFVTGVLMTTCSALVVSAAFFIFIPRMWVGAEVTMRDDGDARSVAMRKTGLATSVRLGDLGPILESTEPVFEMRLTNLKTNESLSAQQYADSLGMAEPLFRGAVLTNYARGRWSADVPSHSLNSRIFERPNARVDVRQEIRLAPSSNDILYCLGQPLVIADSRHNPMGEINEISAVASRGDLKGDNSPSDYEAFTVLPTKHQANYRLRIPARIQDVYARFHYLDLNRKLPPGLTRLKELTSEVLAREVENRQNAEGREMPRKLTPLEIATTLESYLRDSGQYRYSLDMSISDPNLDPIEDFLFVRKTGHCEYFATALALMLRAADVPARIVSGFKGGLEHVSVGRNVFEVQQKFAHLWVEAALEKDAWTTLDATPMEARAISIASVVGKKSSIWADVQTTLSGLWSENVLNMTLDRQEQSIYKPIREIAFSLGKFVKQLITSPRSAAQTLWGLLTDREHWFSVGGVIFALAFTVLLVGSICLCYWLTNRIRGLIAMLVDRRSGQHRRVIEFYDRFVRLMQARGLERRSTQTQSEFADQVASAFSPELKASGLFDVPGMISRLFYQVRFGNQNLPATDLEQLEVLMKRLEQTLPNGTHHTANHSSAATH